MSTIIHRTHLARVAVLLALTLALLPLGASQARAADAGQELELAQLINQERQAAGLTALQFQSQLTSIARDWSVRMAADGFISHRPDLATIVKGNWTGLAENVGVGQSMSSLHTAFMNSPGHAKNVLGNYEYVGIGVVTSGGRQWVTVNFGRGQINGTATPVSAPKGVATSVFSDVYTTGTHAPGILAVHARGIVKGYDGGTFRPNAPVTRAQMATYVANALGLETGGTSRYADVPTGNAHTGSIAAVTDAGIMRPCATAKFCPTAPVLRGEMAQILTDAFALPFVKTWSFADITTSSLSRYVSAIAEAGVTSGCEPQRFCPGDAVTRGQMATFFALAMDLI